MFYLRPLRLPGTGRILANKPMGSFPVYVPPKLKSSATAKGLKCQQQNTQKIPTSKDRQQTSGGGREPTGHRPSVVTDVVSVGLPEVLVLRVVQGAQRYRTSRGQIVHHHLERLVDQSPSGLDREERGHGLGHGRQLSVEEHMSTELQFTGCNLMIVNN